MSERPANLLRSVHGVPASEVASRRRRIPDFPFLETRHAKAKFGFAGEMVILTFGLLSPNKGIEIMLNAMPEIIKSCPVAVYVVLGATQPDLVRDRGEAYRDGLVARVPELGIDDHVVFFDHSSTKHAAGLHLNVQRLYNSLIDEAQMTSGTLAYSFGLGKAVVSTPYWHAKELLSDGRGILVPFGNAKAVGGEIAGLQTNDVKRHGMRKRAYAATDDDVGANGQAPSRELRERASAPGLRSCFRLLGAVSRRRTARFRRSGSPFPLALRWYRLSPARRPSVPDRAHGYCVDDNARACCSLARSQVLANSACPRTMTASFAAFVPARLEPRQPALPQLHGLQPLLAGTGGLGGQSRADAVGIGRMRPQRYRCVSPPVGCGPLQDGASRGRGFLLSARVGLHAPGAGCLLHTCSWGHLRQSAARDIGRPVDVHALRSDRDWLWFEDVLAYDNARLPQALIQTGLTIHAPSYVEAGLRSLRWLMPLQTAPSGCFRPVGSKSFGAYRMNPEAFDQQPVEAAATISACLAAGRADGSAEWSAGAMRAFNWFLGENDLQTTLIDPDTGSCSDGLHPDRPNENKGAEYFAVLSSWSGGDTSVQARCRA